MLAAGSIQSSIGHALCCKKEVSTLFFNRIQLKLGGNDLNMLRSGRDTNNHILTKNHSHLAQYSVSRKYQTYTPPPFSAQNHLHLITRTNYLAIHDIPNIPHPPPPHHLNTTSTTKPPHALPTNHKPHPASPRLNSPQTPTPPPPS